MQELLDRLAEILRIETGYYSEMLEASQLKKSVIADGKIDELDKMIKREQIFLVRINDIEQKRLKLVLEIAKHGKIYKKDIALTDILKICDSKRREELKKITDELSKTLKKLSEYNDINRKMISDRLEYINFMVSATRETLVQGNNYGAKGVGADSPERKKLSMLDQKA